MAIPRLFGIVFELIPPLLDGPEHDSPNQDFQTNLSQRSNEQDYSCNELGQIGSLVARTSDLNSLLLARVLLQPSRRLRGVKWESGSKEVKIRNFSFCKES